MPKVLQLRSLKEMRNVFETGGKAILVIKWQKTWLKCVMLGGKQNLYGINWDIQMRFPSKVLKVWADSPSSLR